MACGGERPRTEIDAMWPTPTPARRLALALLLCAVAMAGCRYSRVPRIDPTGRRIFAEPPISETPVYRDPADACRAGDDVGVTLHPASIVVPVGGEVVLVAGVKGPDGYLTTGRRLEWSLEADDVGHFVAVGRNGMIDRLLGDNVRARKVDNHYAVGTTSRDYLKLGRGTPATEDDVRVAAGEGWVSLTSPTEGTSRVTVMAPSVRAWDKRMATAVIQWLDADVTYPPPAINPAGTRHTLTTTVVRHSDRRPCAGWLVRYRISDGPAAGLRRTGARRSRCRPTRRARPRLKSSSRRPPPAPTGSASR